MKKIIGVCGFIGSGKDTIADYLVNIHGFRRDSFASSLKDVCASVFGWDREMLEGRTKESREWREQVDPWWTERLGMNITPRWILQYWGTEVCRKGFHNDIWIASLEHRLANARDNIVISDVRFPNEIAALRNAGGQVVWVQRGALPDWYDTALGANAGIKPDQKLLVQLGIHSSETAWIGADFDHVIKNDTTFDELYSQVSRIIED